MAEPTSAQEMFKGRHFDRDIIPQVPEQDHRRLKQRIRPMLEFKRFETAAVTIQGVELAEKIKKPPFDLRPHRKRHTAPEIWAMVLAA